MRQIVLPALIVVVIALSAGTGCAPKTPEAEQRPLGVDYYVRGSQFYRAGQRDEAIKLLEQAVAANPDLRMAQSMLGDAYRGKGDYEKAAIHYDAASRLDRYNANNQYNLGVAYQFLNRLKDAAAAYIRALQLNPKDVKSNMNLGLVYLALGQTDDAVTFLERATRLDPKNAAAWSNLGVAMDARGSAVLAESTYRKALELASDNTVTLQNLAQNLIGQGKSSEAISIMEQVLTRIDTPSAHKRYGDALADAKRYDDAMKQYDIALQLDSRFLPALNEKGFLLIKRYVDGLDLDDSLRVNALQIWQSSLKLNPNQPRIVDAIKKWEKPGLFGG